MDVEGLSFVFSVHVLQGGQFFLEHGVGEVLRCNRVVFFGHLLLPLGGSAQLLQDPGDGEIDSIVALVDEDVILRSELDQAVAGIVQQIRARGEAMPPMHLLEAQVLERLIITELQVQRAMQTGIRVSDADIDQYLVSIAQANGITVQQMRQSIESEGMDFSEFRADIAEQMMAERHCERRNRPSLRCSSNGATQPEDSANGTPVAADRQESRKRTASTSRQSPFGASATRCDEIRLSSVMRTRITFARSGTSMSRSRSTASE